MLTTAPLAEWLNSPALQEAASQRSIAFANRWAREPLFADARSALQGGGSLTSEAVLDVARRFVSRDDDLRRLIDDLIAEARADPFFRPPFEVRVSEVAKGYVLFNSDQLTINLNIVSPDAMAAKKLRHGGKGNVAFTGMVTLYRYLKSGGATLSIWEAPSADANFSAHGEAVLKRIEERRIRDGESWVMDGRRQSFLIDHATSDMIFLQAQVKADAAPLAVAYDVDTGIFAGASATDDASSRVQMMVTLLRLMEHDGAVPVMGELLNSPHFFVRWHLMREFLAMNAEAALPHLKRMAAGDPHPEVGEAARQTLRMFFPDEEI